MAAGGAFAAYQPLSSDARCARIIRAGPGVFTRACYSLRNRPGCGRCLLTAGGAQESRFASAAPSCREVGRSAHLSLMGRKWAAWLRWADIAPVEARHG